MKEQLTNKFSIEKTLINTLIPIGKTEENFNNKLLLENDKKRAENYKVVKKIMDRFHKDFIEDVLSKFILENILLREYSDLYYKKDKTDKEKETMNGLETKLRTSISKALTNDERYSKLNKKEFVEELLPSYLTDEEEKKAVEGFYKFTTYFQGFWNNRKNMYTYKEQSTAISYRCINDNLPKFLDNVKSFEKVAEKLPAETLETLNENFSGLCGTKIEDVFCIDYFTFVLAQSGIERYNKIIGGYPTSDSQNVQGLNASINLYNQSVAKNDKSKRLPLMKPLFKQILSDKDSISFIIPESFKDDNEVLKSINTFYNSTENVFDETAKLFEEFETYNSNFIYISNKEDLTTISKKLFDSWNVVTNNWNSEYEQTHICKKGKEEKFYEQEKKDFKKIKSFSLSEIQRLGKDDKKNIEEYFKNTIISLVKDVKNSFASIKELVSNPYQSNVRLASNESEVEKIKTFLDSVKELERTMKILCGTGKEEEKDNTFYGKFLPLFEEVKKVDTLYNKVRNYLTQKPYSNDKIKLNFENSQFLGGWDRNYEEKYRSVLLKKDNKYYLAIMDKTNNKVFSQMPKIEDNEPFYEKMEYKLIPGPSKMLPKVFFAKSNIDTFKPSDEILNIRNKGSFKKGTTFDIKDCHKFIDFYKESINIHSDWKKFGFEFTDTKDYEDISKFFKEVSEQGYSINFNPISEKYINSMVENGSLYLFQIYNKDFSEYSKGTKNLHTLYFNMLFDERNLADVVYRLNGECEMFYREASIKDSEKIVHPANQPIDNKNPENAKKQSEFSYDIIKDRRYTKRSFSLHIPITMNFKASRNGSINYDVQNLLRESNKHYVIGIDRGERNLIYISVIDEKGNIVEQKSLNEIVSDNGYKVNYHSILDSREKERDNARKDWKTIGTIKELKEGYLSQVIHEICILIEKYDAIIAMEDLNSGFMNNRKKVEKQVYQKFEKMLTDKLKYLVNKEKDASEVGGLLNAYQLTNSETKSNVKQDGIIFYIPAWATSKIDPTTGFVNLLHAKYTSVPSSQSFFKTFDNISFNEKEDMFEFDIDYDNFPKCQTDFKKKWTICSNGERIKTFRNKDKNNKVDYEIINLTKEFKKLFSENEIDYSSNLKEQIIKKDDKGFFENLLKLLSLTLQMRNSITGRVDVDYLISPVKNKDGKFYDSRDYEKMDNAPLPKDADANGAYNIARKGLWAIEQIKKTPESKKPNLSISNKEWLEFAQNG